MNAPEGPHAATPTLALAADRLLEAVERTLHGRAPRPRVIEVGVVRAVGKGVARVGGLPSVRSDEVVTLSGGVPGLVFNLDPDEVGVILLGDEEGVAAGDEVRASGSVLRVPVGDELLGRVVDPLGHPLDDGPPLRSLRTRPVESPAPGIMKRRPVRVPLQTGLKVVDALIPVGRGQRELIVGDRQTGKTAIATDAIVNQQGEGVTCVYCAVGQRSASVAQVVRELADAGAMKYTVVVVATGEDPPGLQYVAPYAATSVAEHFLDRGGDVLVVYDDLTKHARAYRELSLLLRRPPGREGYPGDVFYLHARLLERSTRLREEYGGGSITALPIVETQAGNLAAYIPTNLVSITDGQIYLTPALFQKGVLPAVDVGRSVSRVGGDAQLPAYRAVAQRLRLSYSQFQELEVFSRFSTQLDDETWRTLERGRRVREVLQQDQNDPWTVPEQIAVLFAVTEGLLDGVPIAELEAAQARIRTWVPERLPELSARIQDGEPLTDADRDALRREAVRALGAGAEA